MMMDLSAPQVLFLFVIVWIITFPIAWKMLAVLVSLSLQNGATRKPSFWFFFIFYRFVIFSPYLVLIIFGQSLPGIVRSLIWGWVILAVFLSFLRFLGSEKVANTLWYIYGYVYDGLNNFFPYKLLIKKVSERLDVESGMRVLDLGCGTGNLIKFFIGKGANIDAVDNSISMLKRFRKKYSNEIESGDIKLYQEEVIDFLKSQPDKSYDRIAMVNVIYAVPDRQLLWDEVARVLKQDGLVVATTSDRTGSLALIKEHVRNDNPLKLLDPRLICVAIIDTFISELSKSVVFNFPKKETLLREAETAGKIEGEVERCYGGPKDGVNILFSIRSNR